MTSYYNGWTLMGVFRFEESAYGIPPERLRDLVPEGPWLQFVFDREDELARIRVDVISPPFSYANEKRHYFVMFPIYPSRERWGVVSWPIWLFAVDNDVEEMDTVLGTLLRWAKEKLK